MMTVKTQVKPFLKWAGGKRQLIPELLKYIPSSYNHYYEPFLGGGALFFELQPRSAFLSDTNGELINCYKVIRDHVEPLIYKLRSHQELHSEEHYYSIRGQDRLPNSISDSVVAAARTIYLNKTCFNGLYRVNRKGQFNTPIGSYKNPNIDDESNLRLVSELLNHHLSDRNLYSNDFSISMELPRRGDFVYLDPPYIPVNKDSFVAYSKDGFGYDDQMKLKIMVDRLTERGCYVLMSNSSTPTTKSLYKNYPKITLHAKRNINSKGDKRHVVDELLIMNY